MAESKFWTPKRRMFWAIGGLLILLTAAGVLTAYLVVANTHEGAPRSAAKGELAAYLSDEHKAAFRDGTRLDQKFPVTDSAALADALRDWVGNRITIEELFPAAGVKLLGAGRSAVPGTGESAHLRLVPEPARPDINLSLFIKQYRQLPTLEDQAAYTLTARLGEGAPPITVWRRGGLVYYLVSNSAEGIQVLRQGLGTPEPKKPY